MKRITALAGVLFASVLLVACGSGSSDAPTAPADSNEVPPGAMVTAAAFIGYADALPASETKEPLDITKAMPPTSETTEPLPI